MTESKLAVYRFGEPIGDLWEEAGDYLFAYRSAYIARDGAALNGEMPLRETIYTSKGMMFPYFENLLPEGVNLEITHKEVGQDPLELLRHAGRTLSGALRFGDGAQRTRTNKRQLNQAESYKKQFEFARSLGSPDRPVVGYYDQQTLDTFGLDPYFHLPFRYDDMVQVSADNFRDGGYVSGFQGKISGYIHNQQQEIGSAARFVGMIVKYPSTAVLQHYCEAEQAAMKILGLLMGERNVAASTLVPTADGQLVYVTKRFDRDESGNSYDMRDFAQILNRTSKEKYSLSSFEPIGRYLDTHSKTPKLDKNKVLSVLVYSIVLGNTDLHLKNLAMIQRPNRDFWEFSPVYDVVPVSTLVAQQGNAIKKSKFGAAEVRQAAKALGLDGERVDELLGVFEKQEERIRAQIELSYMSLPMKRHLQEHILHTLKELRRKRIRPATSHQTR